MVALEIIHGDPLRLTVDEWAGLPTIESASGMATFGYAVGCYVTEANRDRAPDAPLLTHDEYLRSVA